MTNSDSPCLDRDHGCGLLIASPAGLGAGRRGGPERQPLDKTGTLLADATVTVKNERTGEERVVKSNAQGLYRVTKLKPSIYTVGLQRPTSPLEYTGMELAAGLAMSLDLR